MPHVGTMERPPSRSRALQAECAELRARLDEAEDTLAAIRSGDVDALVVGEDIYTLDSANAATNTLRKDVLAQMEDAVVAFDVDDHVIFMNPAAERQYGRARRRRSAGRAPSFQRELARRRRRRRASRRDALARPARTARSRSMPATTAGRSTSRPPLAPARTRTARRSARWR